MTAIVLVHGAHHGSWLWRDVIPLLDAPAVAVDLPGRNDRTRLRPLSLADCVHTVVDRIETARLQRAVIVGHSLAGTVAYAAAVGSPATSTGTRPTGSSTGSVRKWPRSSATRFPGSSCRPTSLVRPWCAARTTRSARGDSVDSPAASAP